jgi:Ca2+-binding EF-hand superfamily protein
VATFNSLDVNRDGYLSRQEARASSTLASQFDGLDKDRDGKLSMHELTGWRTAAAYGSTTNMTASTRSGTTGHDVKRGY